jgi:hypothetical protein
MLLIAGRVFLQKFHLSAQLEVSFFGEEVQKFYYSFFFLCSRKNQLPKRGDDVFVQGFPEVLDKQKVCSF